MNAADKVSLVGVIATFLAVIVALFKEEIVKIWRRPSVDATLDLRAPDCHKTVMTIHNPAKNEVLASDCYYFRMWVKNTGNMPITDVQVFASKLYQRNSEGRFTKVDDFTPMNFKWSHTHEIFAQRISPKMGKHCDMGHIINPQFKPLIGENLPDNPPENTVFAMDLEVKPNTLSHLIGPGSYRLLIKIAADNCAPRSKTIEFSFNGQWHQDEEQMFENGVQMSMS